jgi:energy-coupling factor transporter ATP-binding protein EcfA2
LNAQPLHLALDALLLLGYKHQPEVRVGDLVLIAHGRLHHWRQWNHLSELEQNRYLCLLRYSHLNEINKTRLIKLLNDRIKADDSPFEFISSHQEADSKRYYRVLPGKPIEQQVDEIISALKNLQSASPIKFKKRSNNQFWVRNSFYGKTFKIPYKLVPDNINPTKTKKASSLKNLSISYVELMEQAENISRLTGQAFYKKRMKIFLDELRCRKPDKKIENLVFTAGELQMLIAPTGRGKSVFSRVLATLLIKKGINVTLVLPLIKDVIQEYRLCSEILQKQSPDKRASMLFSSRSQGRIVVDLLRNSVNDSNSNDAVNILETVGYHCALQAYVEDGEEIPFGDEPCRHSRFNCPFLSECPKFRHQKSAFDAQLLIINHHAFLSGRLSLPAEDEESIRINTYFNLVVKRSHCVIVDEIDQLQQVLIVNGQNYCPKGGQLFWPLTRYKTQR